MRRLGNKVAARNLAVEIGVPVIPATDPLPDDLDEIKRLAEKIGYFEYGPENMSRGGSTRSRYREPLK